MSKVLKFFHFKTFQLSWFNSNWKHGSVLGAALEQRAARRAQPVPEGRQRPRRARSRPCVPAPPLPAALRRHRARPVPSREPREHRQGCRGCCGASGAPSATAAGAPSLPPVRPLRVRLRAQASLPAPRWVPTAEKAVKSLTQEVHSSTGLFNVFLR